MLNADFFRDVLYQQVDSMGAGRVTAKILMRDGLEWAIKSVLKVHNDYLILEVYPAEIGEADDDDTINEAFRRRTVAGADKPTHDQVAICYPDIARVLFSAVEPASDSHRIGFAISKE